MKVCQVCGARFRGNPAVCPLDGGELVKAPDPLVGITIAGRYVIHERIGSGGMGVVYRARHDVVGRDVAVKFLSTDLAFEPANKTRFLREARAANRINHEHIIDITDFGETDEGHVYLVMEFLDGTPLNEVIARGPMPVRRALAITWQASQALARAHELDVVHRDIKPDNIYLLRGYEDDFVKILDFGLAHMKGELRVTATGTIFGTPEYMSPEHARGAPVGPAADLYSLGCVLFEMLTGELPFQGATPDLILKHLREPARAPSFHAPQLPTEIDAIVLRLLEKDPGDRFDNAHELGAELRQWLDRDRDSAVPNLPAREPAGADNGGGRPSFLKEPPLGSLAESSVEGGRGEEAESHPSATELVRRWRERVETFQSLVGQAHPTSEPPPWLGEALRHLHAQVDELNTLHEALKTRASRASHQQDEAKAARMRIGRALDELAADESRVSLSVGDMNTRLVEARARVEQVEVPLRRAWQKLADFPREASLDERLLTALRDAGALASIRLESARAAAGLEEQLSQQRRQLDDLAFQIAQLKGRFGSFSAVTDLDLDDLRDETTILDRQIQERLQEIVRAAEPVVRHFMGFGHLRDRVRGTHADGVQ